MSTLPFSLKAGVNPSGVTDQLVSGLGIAQNVYASFGQPFTITSLTEGVHVIDSKHYSGQAADLRTNGIDPSLVPQIAQQLQAQLGPSYYVLLEGDHIHMQYNGIGTVSGDTGLPTDTTALPDPTSSTFDPTALLSDLGISTDSITASSVDWTTIGLVGLGLLALWWVADEFF